MRDLKNYCTKFTLELYSKNAPRPSPCAAAASVSPSLPRTVATLPTSISRRAAHDGSALAGSRTPRAMANDANHSSRSFAVRNELTWRAYSKDVSFVKF